jgi:hypothetical protein
MSIIINRNDRGSRCLGILGRSHRGRDHDGVQRMYQAGNGGQVARALFGGLVLLLAGSTPLSSAVYQCTGPDGSIVFADSPCGADAKEIVVRPQAPMSNTAPAAKRPATGTTNRGKTSSDSPAARDAEALKCEAREYGAWYQTQNPKPTREQSDLKMKQIVDSCWLSTHLVSASDNVTVNPDVKTVIHSAPQPVGGSAGMATAPAGAGGPLQVSRSRQAEEATRWDNYYSCRTQAYQEWSNALDHTPDDAEASAAQARTDSQCRAQFNIPSGAAAILTD